MGDIVSCENRTYPAQKKYMALLNPSTITWKECNHVRKEADFQVIFCPVQGRKASFDGSVLNESFIFAFLDIEEAPFSITMFLMNNIFYILLGAIVVLFIYFTVVGRRKMRKR
jgi:hypothetical protein